MCRRRRFPSGRLTEDYPRASQSPPPPPPPSYAGHEHGARLKKGTFSGRADVSRAPKTREQAHVMQAKTVM